MHRRLLLKTRIGRNRPNGEVRVDAFASRKRTASHSPDFGVGLRLKRPEACRSRIGKEQNADIRYPLWGIGARLT